MRCQSGPDSKMFDKICWRKKEKNSVQYSTLKSKFAGMAKIVVTNENINPNFFILTGASYQPQRSTAAIPKDAPARAGQRHVSRNRPVMNLQQFFNYTPYSFDLGCWLLLSDIFTQPYIDVLCRCFCSFHHCYDDTYVPLCSKYTWWFVREEEGKKHCSACLFIWSSQQRWVS